MLNVAFTIPLVLNANNIFSIVFTQMEQQVEETRKKWTERHEEHIKVGYLFCYISIVVKEVLHYFLAV